MRSILPPWPSASEAVEEPIRAELFGIERLEQHAESLAAAQRVTEGWELGQPLLARVEDNGRVLRDANRAIAEAVQEERWITPAAEWLVDNFYIVDEQLREIRDDLPAGFYRELPKLADAPLAGYPRVYGLAWAFVAHTDSRFDPETLRRFVQAYQRVQPLTIGELWAVAITLRVVLVENLRRLADAIVRSRVARHEADELADDLLGLGGGGVRSVTAALHRYEGEPLVTAFAVELLQRLRDQDPAVTPTLVWLNQRLAAQGTNADAIALLEHQQQAAMTVTIRNIITSMRLMSAFDWSAFFESVSLVDDILRADANYSAMDFISRDRYRHAVEELARGSKHSELDIARAALAEAQQAHITPPIPESGRDDRWTDPGYYLVGNARRAFEEKLGFSPDAPHAGDARFHRLGDAGLSRHDLPPHAVHPRVSARAVRRARHERPGPRDAGRVRRRAGVRPGDRAAESRRHHARAARHPAAVGVARGRSSRTPDDGGRPDAAHEPAGRR